LAVVTVAPSAAPAFVEGVPADAEITGAAWSPDGRRIAYCTGTSQYLDRDDLRELESRLVVADPTGRNATVIRSVKGESYHSVFWR
jgi:hypothetical protein